MRKLALITVLAAFGVITASGQANGREQLMSNSEVNEAEFWAIIGRSVPASANHDMQIRALKSELRALSVPQIESFGRAFDQVLQDSYSWDLWGAASVIMGGASDDGFEYFRVWMISQGRTFFYAAKHDPDSMAALIPSGYKDAPDFELLVYVASQVWAEKTGKPSNDMPTQPPMMYLGREPSGKPFPEDEMGLRKRYPKLWARFGRAPLQ